ncbi:MAG: ABC transporter ATP-binding protein, partial [Erysipelotrichia bacterium]|nr:ABC transporter ATP-binding protein [Erysipelotrichia bacterium]
MKQPLIKLSHVSKYYKTRTGVSEGMRDINLEFYNNEFVAITGESGSGKTTLLNVISGLDTYEDGELFYEGRETSHYTVKDFEKFRARNIGFVFQNYNVIDAYTVYDNVELALLAQNYPKAKIKGRAIKLIEQVGLLSHINQRTSKLSGGQKQRVVIARALAKDAPIILADAPTGNLDEQSGDEVLSLLKEISKDRLVIMVSHNMKEVDKFATRKIIMSDGNIKNDIILEKTISLKANLNADKTKNNSFKKGFKIAFKNILKTPKRSIFTLFLSSIVLFIIVYFYSTLVVNVVDSITNNLSSDAKIALVKRDESKFTK